MIPLDQVPHRSVRRSLRYRHLHGALLMLALSAAYGVAYSQPVSIPGLYNTGVDDNATALPLGTLDHHYDMVGPASPAYTVAAHAAWVPPPSNASWIGPSNGNQTGPEGQYVYELSFDLTGLDPSSAVVWGEWASDNNSFIQLNGVDTGYSNGLYGFEQLRGFHLSAGFVAGVNTLRFVVVNHPYSGPNPTGLLVAGLEGDALVPVEANTWGKIKASFR